MHKTKFCYVCFTPFSMLLVDLWNESQSMKKKKKNEFFSPERRRKPVTVSDILSRNTHVTLVCLIAGNILNHSPPIVCFDPSFQFIRGATNPLPDICHVLMPHVSGSSFCLLLQEFHVTSQQSSCHVVFDGLSSRSYSPPWFSLVCFLPVVQFFHTCMRSLDVRFYTGFLRVKPYGTTDSDVYATDIKDILQMWAFWWI